MYFLPADSCVSLFEVWSTLMFVYLRACEDFQHYFRIAPCSLCMQFLGKRKQWLKSSLSWSLCFVLEYQKYSMVRLQRTWLSSLVLMFLGELSGLLTNFYWSNQHTSSNWLAWGLSQCARLTSGTRFHLRLKAAHLSLFLKLSLRPIFFDKHIFRL